MAATLPAVGEGDVLFARPQTLIQGKHYRRTRCYLGEHQHLRPRGPKVLIVACSSSPPQVTLAIASQLLQHSSSSRNKVTRQSIDLHKADDSTDGSLTRRRRGRPQMLRKWCTWHRRRAALPTIVARLQLAVGCAAYGVGTVGQVSIAHLSNHERHDDRANRSSGRYSAAVQPSQSKSEASPSSHSSDGRRATTGDGGERSPQLPLPPKSSVVSSLRRCT